MNVPDRTPERAAPAPSAVEALLDRAEQDALNDLRRAAVGAGEVFVAASGVRARARAHPLLAATAAGALGFWLAPLLVNALRRSRASRAASLALGALPVAFRRQLLHAALRSVRATP